MNFCEKIKLDNIIHIENDVLIFQDLSKFKKVFQKFYNIGMTFLNFNLCVPGFVYFKNYKKLNQICPHKWERDWSDRGHRSSKYCVWCGN